jgi:hypothetical protein
MNPYERLARWALTDDTGMSSKAIGSRYLNLPPPHGYYSHPHDSADFGRCYRLLQAMPQIDIAIMRGTTQTWDRLVAHWPALTMAYEHELPQERWPEFHALLNTILRP